MAEDSNVVIAPALEPETGQPVYRVKIPYTPDRPGIADEAFYLDPSVNYTVVRWELLNGRTGEPVCYTEMVQLSEVVDGIGVPVAYRLYTPAPEIGGDVQGVIYEVSVEDVKVNTGIADTTFTIEYPAGTIVRDTRGEPPLVYEVGYTAPEMDTRMARYVDDVRSANARVAQGRTTNIPTLADDREISHQGPCAVDASSMRGNPARLVSLGALGLCFVAVSLAVARTRRIGSIPVRVLCMCLTAGITLFAAVAVEARFSGLPAAVTAIHRGLKGTASAPSTSFSGRPILDCGTGLLCFLAQYYDTGWTAERVYRQSPKGGMSLADLQEAARAMGLNAEGVQVKDGASIRRLLEGGKAALIMATTLEQGRSEGHFFGIVGADPDYLIIVEPPKGIARVADSRLADAIRRQNGYGLIITP